MANPLGTPPTSPGPGGMGKSGFGAYKGGHENDKTTRRRKNAHRLHRSNWRDAGQMAHELYRQETTEKREEEVSVNSQRLLGRYSADAGRQQEITIGDRITLSSDGALSADVPASDSINFTQIQNITTQRVLGRGTAGTGDIEQLTLGTGLAFSGTSLILSHLGIQALTDPNADRIAFWDDSEGAFGWLTIGAGLSISGTTLSSTVAGTLTTSAQTANFNASSGNLYVVDASGGSVTATLGASPTTDDRIGFKLNVTSGSNTLTISGNGKNIQDASSQVLYVDGDYLEIQYNGTQWNIVAQRVQPHFAWMYRTAAQTIGTATFTKINLNVVNPFTGQGGIEDSTTDFRVEIRRTGRYRITGRIALGVAFSGGFLVALIYVNGSEVARAMLTGSQSVDATAEVNHLSYLAAGDYVELYIYQDHGSNRDTSTATGSRPTLYVNEVLP